MSDLSSAKFYIKTFGCQMNESDSERIAGWLTAAGARPAASLDESQIVIINTCAVREKSEEKLYSYLGRLRARKAKTGLVIAVAGCVAQLHRDALRGKKTIVDIVVGPDHYHRLPEILSRNLAEPGDLTAWSRTWAETKRGAALRTSSASAFVTIMEGCDNFCAYCIVPFTRGREKFRPLGAILDELNSLAGRGTKEIQFLGQNVNSYRDPDSGVSFAALLDRTADIEGLEWIRFITSNPKNFGPDIIAAMARSPKICRQLHLPLQSGSSSVLSRMRRGYSYRDYLETVRVLRTAMPGICLSTDIIVGFPGETEEEFRETMSALDEIRFANIFSFRYSPRPRTAAAKLVDDVSFDVKRRRLMEVQRLQKSIQAEIHKDFIGRTIRVLGTGPSPKDPRVTSGRSEGYQVVNFAAPEDVVGRFVRVHITDCGPYSLLGEIAAAS